ncbi:TetR/AcrR family transcriptional regulator [Amantichitinum ursilacus]|uniref:HTH-type transcriptional repressor NemR n=1 Tax=Amantichitinum ursilacus TaxID=857265 RepID=A0A0N0XL14_9NEIS|nr:TetR/AcrR family transcriptional regulator [Amantichitinum ursilacus]KPC54699.1 HTH-type transcriptional repressor NemR [Amantichitinum ursilacus]
MVKKRFEDTREHLLATGEQIILGKGFAAVGLAEILAAADVPKGSFYHYFVSKEAFGVALLERYFANYTEELKLRLNAVDGTPHDRVIGFFSGWHQRSCGASVPCLVVKLAAEVADLSDTMRAALQSGAETIVSAITRTVEQGQQDGTISRTQTAPVLALALYEFWLGASLMTKLRRDAQGLDTAMIVTRQLLTP